VSANAPTVHLLSAGEAFRQRFPSTLVAVCGEPVASEPGIEDDHRYCADCVSAAIQCGQGLDDSCPGCGATSDHLAATAELAGARSALRALLTLADDAPTLTDAELRSRLMALAGRAGMRLR
jgi:hypothetical protein